MNNSFSRLFLLLCCCASATKAFTTTRTSGVSAVRERNPLSIVRRQTFEYPLSVHHRRLSPLHVSLNDLGEQIEAQELLSSTTPTPVRQEEKWVDESKHVELELLLAWMASISAFILVNNFVGPWPTFFEHVPERFFFFGHMLGGVLFGGGVILTTCIEWMVAHNKNPTVMQFWFDKVPLLDMAIVLPGLTLSMISGTGLTIVRYGGLDHAPTHIISAFWALVVFAAWWALTDLTTQGSALNAVLEASVTLSDDNDPKMEHVPDEVTGRTLSNVVSCGLVLVLYGIMVLKPGTLHYF